MRRPQFSLKSLLWLIYVLGVAIQVGALAWHFVDPTVVTPPERRLTMGALYIAISVPIVALYAVLGVRVVQFVASIFERPKQD